MLAIRSSSCCSRKAARRYLSLVMTIAALLGLPGVLFYQWWTYRVFRGRIGRAQFER